MRWKNRFHASFEWHEWFAWRPVDVGGSVVWLEKVERKRVHIGFPSSPYMWNYRELLE